MSDKNKNKKNRLTDFLRYHSKELSGKERNSFERELQKDPFAEEASEGFSSISHEDVFKDISDLHKRIKIRTGIKRRLPIYRIAASLALLMAITTIYFYVSRNKPVKTLADNSVQSNQMEISKSQPIKQSPATEEIHTEKKLDSRNKSESTSLQKRQSEIAKNIETTDKLPIAEVLKSDSISDLTKNRGNANFKSQQMAAPVSIFARERSVSSYNVRGKILSSEDNLPLPGANVYVKGTKTGVVTDSEGNFNISLPDSNKRLLTANFIGMEPKEFMPKSDSEVKVTLEPSVASLSEVVVVGYGMDKKEVTGAVNSTKHTPATPVIGKSDFDKYIRNNLHRPDTTTSGQRVVVVVSFLVQTDGSIDSIRIVKSPGKSFSDEAIRILKSGPKWKPAEDNGRQVEDIVKLRLVFK
jgi:hypothetical protein